MHFKKFLAPVMAPLALSLAFGLAACGDDSSSGTPDTPVVDPTTDPTLNPVVDPSTNPTDPSTNPVTNPTDPSTNPSTNPTDPSTNPTTNPTTPTSSWTSPVALATSANPAYPANVYALWKPSHFATLEDELVYYSSSAADFADIFTAQYLPAGRVLWSNQNTGYYKQSCLNKDSDVASMKYRGCTVSEGVGYGMLLTYFNGDDDAFVRIWNYSRAFRDYYGVDLTPWITFSFAKKVDYTSATDADLDIATALVLMYYKTGSAAYLNDALRIMKAIWDLEINKTSLLIYSGDDDMWQGDDPVYNLSYFSPVALRLFAKVDTDPSHNWTGVLDAMYTYMTTVQNAGTGVFPDWSNSAGVAVDPDNGSAAKTYWTFNKESVRIPWRIAWDYYWFQDERALAILTKLNTFISGKSGGDPSSNALMVNYSWDPAKSDAASTGTATPSHWLGAWCVTGLGSNPTWVTACTDLFNTRTPANTGSSYFTDILMGIYSALLNGNFVRPF